MPDRTLIEIQRSRPDWSRLTSILYAMMCLALLGTFCAPAAAAGGQDHGLASLVKDLNPATAPSTPDDFVIVGGTLFFTAADPQHGRELWRSDGTEGGTALLADINAGADSSGITHMTIFNNTLYFAAYDHQRRPQLWRSDGTPAGTILVFDFASPPYIGYISDLVVASNKLFIQTYLEGIASNHTFLAAARLWRSDGTASGTHRIEDTETPSALYDSQSGLTLSGHQLFFVGRVGELWAIHISDGVDTDAAAPATSFVPAHGQGFIQINYANRGSQPATSVMLMVTLPDSLTYAGDDTGVTPTQIGNTLTWHLPDAGFLDTRTMHLRINTPSAPLGTRYPVTIALGSAEPDAAPADNSASTVVQLARQMFVPLMVRACVYSYTCEEPL
jgi:ELWxxDGT repeat protein